MTTIDPVVATESGKVRGFVEEQASVFLGVPYAEPPVGEHRLKAPVRRAPWEGVRDALAYGPTAPQPDVDFTIIPEPVIEGDDCLSLNIFTPDPGGGGLPVLVWIHGGGFVTGCSASPWYRGCRFARDGVVVVSINYRLGAEGFLSVDGAPDNRGALDWVAALDWVQRNIAAFGGDPGRVTVAGQSAGGVAALALMAMPSARGLFRQVIAMSGAALFSGSPEAAGRLAQAVAKALGCAPTRDDLSRFSTDELVRALGGLQRRDLGGAGLFIDGATLPADPIESVTAGVGSTMPLLTGSTRDEAIPMLIQSADGIDSERFVRRMGRLGLSEQQADSYRRLLPDLPLWRVLARAVSDQMFRLRAARLADARVEAGAAGSVEAGAAGSAVGGAAGSAVGGGSAAAAAGSPTWAYEFRWPSPALGGFGACHCIDLPFVFDNLDAHWVETVAGTEVPQVLADTMHSAWVSFISNGYPGWPNYDRDRRPVMVFDRDSAVVDDPLRWEREIWSKATS